MSDGPAPIDQRGNADDDPHAEHGAIRELNADEMEFVTGGTLAVIAGAIKLASAIADATGGPINFSKLCEWARQQQ